MLTESEILADDELLAEALNSLLETRMVRVVVCYQMTPKGVKQWTEAIWSDMSCDAARRLLERIGSG